MKEPRSFQEVQEDEAKGGGKETLDQLNLTRMCGLMIHNSSLVEFVHLLLFLKKSGFSKFLEGSQGSHPNQSTWHQGRDMPLRPNCKRKPLVGFAWLFKQVNIYSLYLIFINFQFISSPRIVQLAIFLNVKVLALHKFGTRWFPKQQPPFSKHLSPVTQSYFASPRHLL